MIFFYFILLTHLPLIYSSSGVPEKKRRKKKTNNERPLIIRIAFIYEFLACGGAFKMLYIFSFFSHFIILLLQTDNITCANFKTKTQLKHRFRDHNAAALAAVYQKYTLNLKYNVKGEPTKMLCLQTK